MSHKHLLFRSEAREKVLHGAAAIADAARVTIGIDKSLIEERFVRAIGPGGQNPRREATAVELRFDIAASPLSADAKDRLRLLAGRAVTADGVLVVVSRVHRSQAENRKAARDRLVALVHQAATPLESRRLTKPRRAVRNQRLAAKRLRGAVKRTRQGGRGGEE